MMHKLPALQFYPGDWRKDPGVQSLDYFERGVWFEILMLMHESEERGCLLLNQKPMPDNRLALLLGLDKQILTTTLTTLVENGVAGRREDGALICRRMVRDERIRYIRAEAGKKGGNPILLNQKSTTQVNQIRTPSSSSSSSISTSEVNTPVLTNGHKPEPKVFNAEGKKKYRDWVYLDEQQLERVKKYYTAKGLGPQEFDEAVRELDSWFENNPKMRAKRTDDARTLMSWPLDRAIERKQNLMRLNNLENKQRK